MQGNSSVTSSSLDRPWAVEAGTLLLNGRLGGSVTVKSGGVLSIAAATGSTAGYLSHNLTVQSGGHLAAGYRSDSFSTLALEKNVTLQSGSVLDVTLGAPGTNTLVLLGGNPVSYTHLRAHETN